MATEIQSIVFDRRHWDINGTKYWLAKHGFRPIKAAHITANTIRYRLHDPNKYTHFITKRLPTEIDYVIGYRP